MAGTVIRQNRAINLIAAAIAATASLLLIASFTIEACVGAQTSRNLPGRREPTAPNRALIRLSINAVGQVFVRNTSQPESRGPSQRGSAVLVRKDGVVVTNYHVIANDQTGRLYDQIFFDLADEKPAPVSKSRRYRLEPILINKELDLALLIIASDGAGNAVADSITFPAIELADSRQVKPLDDLVVIGFPAKGLGGVTVNAGMVEGVDILGNWIKTNARVIHGNSGGAAVDTEGKLIGIPTKVLVDKQVVDNDRDGFPDGEREYGAVGFLRPSHFVATMLAEIGPPGAARQKKGSLVNAGQQSPERNLKVMPKATLPRRLLVVRGVVKSPQDNTAVAGARVGIVRVGTKQITADTLLSWGGTNGEGKFELNNAVPPGQYTIRVKALGYELFTRDVEIKQGDPPIVIELAPSR